MNESADQHYKGDTGASLALLTARVKPGIEPSESFLTWI